MPTINTKPVVAYWTTALDDDRYPQKEKSIGSRDLSVTPVRGDETVNCYYRRGENAVKTDGTGISESVYAYSSDNAKMEKMGWVSFVPENKNRFFRFDALNFVAMSFARRMPVDRYVCPWKIKKYTRLQFCFVNDTVGENLNTEKIVKSFTYGENGKR